MFYIKVPKNDPVFTTDEISYRREAYDPTTGHNLNKPREQINQVTTYIDGSSIYGTEKMWSDYLRSFEGGKLRVQEGYLPPFNDKGYPMINPPAPINNQLQSPYSKFVVGNKRANENPALFALQVVWLREHNIRAEELAREHPDWTDEQLFQRARQWTIAKYQQVAINEWAPAFLGGTLDTYTGYKPEVHPGILIELKAAYRYRYSLFPPGMHMVKTDTTTKQVLKHSNGSCQFGKPVRLCNSYWRPQDSLLNGGFEQMILGMAAQRSEREDNIFVEDLVDYAFGPYEHSRQDLMASNIQLNRDMGMPDYNTVRKFFGLDPVTSFSDVTSNPELAANLSAAYEGNIDDMDMFAASIVEASKNLNGFPGDLDVAILKKQFLRIRDGDRFWFENKNNGLFSDAEILQIKATKFSDVIRRGLVANGYTNFVLQDNVFFNHDEDPQNICFQPNQLSKSSPGMDTCTAMQSYNYGESSVNQLIILVVILAVFGAAMFIIGRWAPLPYGRAPAPRNKGTGSSRAPLRSVTFANQDYRQYNVQVTKNLRSTFEKIRNLSIFSNSAPVTGDVYIGVSEHKCVVFEQPKDKPIMMREVPFKVVKEVIHYKKHDTVLIKLKVDYDLYLRCLVRGASEDLVHDLQEYFTASEGTSLQVTEVRRIGDLDSKFLSQQHRMKEVQEFFATAVQEAYTQSTEIGGILQANRNKLTADQRKALLSTEISRTEFLEMLKVGNASGFVRRLFDLADTDCSGTISYREFVVFMSVFTSDSPQGKMRLMFDLLDMDGSGTISKEELQTVIRESLEAANIKAKGGQMDEMVDQLWKKVDRDGDNCIDFDEFDKVMNVELPRLVSSMAITTTKAPVQKGKRGPSPINAPAKEAYTVNPDEVVAELDGAHTTRSGTYDPQKMMNIIEKAEEEEKQVLGEIDPEARDTPSGFDQNDGVPTWEAVKVYFQTNGPWLWIIVLYTLTCLGVMCERMYTHYVERDAQGLRQHLGGWGVPVASGSAAVINLNFAFLFLSMCKSTITYLRSTKLNDIIPFDYNYEFHKLTGVVILVASVVHTGAHLYNFYTLSQRTITDINCLFPELWLMSDQVSSIVEYWLFRNVAGVTGFLLILGFAFLYPFTLPRVRSYFRRVFWYTHQLYIPLVFLLFAHGLGHFVQAPNFWKYFVFPITLFFFDKAVRWGRTKDVVKVVKAERLPSNVIYLVFEKPDGFVYKSGQWLNIASSASVVQADEYHPFTITSAPHEKYLSLHIRVAGAWTEAVHKLYGGITNPEDFPPVYVDGPFGSIIEDWNRYECVVLVGGGIGVTPFASILKDLLFRLKVAKAEGSKMPIKRIYFFWVSDNQATFEWFGDLLAELEENDHDGILRMYPFVTGRYNKYDVRMMMVWISQHFFQKINGKDLFTGHKTRIFFGRPEWTRLFTQIGNIHKGDKIGVFTCGPASMTKAIDKSCTEVTNSTGQPFDYFRENF